MYAQGELMDMCHACVCCENGCVCERIDIHTAQAARVLTATAVSVVGTCSNVHMLI